MGPQRLRLALTVSVLGGSAMSAGVAAAQPNAAAYVALTWEAPDGCPDASHVEREIARLLDGTARRATPIDARAAVSRGDRGRFRVRIVTHDPAGDGARTIDAESCAAAADATAFILALTVNPAIAASPRLAATAAPVTASPGEAAPSHPATDAPASQPANAPTTRDTPAREPSAPGGPVPAREREDAAPEHAGAAPDGRDVDPGASPRPAPFAAGVELAGDLGTLPRAAIAPRATFAWRPAFLHPEIAVSYFPEVEGAQGTRRGEFSLLAVDVGGCVDIDAGVALVTPCIGPETGVMRGASAGVRSPSAESVLWGAAWASTSVSVLVTRDLAARIDAGAVAPIDRPSFIIDPVGTIHRPAAIAGRAAVGVDLRF